MSPTNELHVIFGTGPLGTWTASELIRLGHQVRLINRSGVTTDLPTGAEVVKGDAYDTPHVIALTQGATAVYQCAQPAYDAWAELFPPLQASILAGAAAAGAKLIVAENLYMYGDTHGQPMNETTPYAAHTRKGKVRQQMTETLEAAQRSGQVRVARARGSDFFGPHDMGYGARLFFPALAGKRVNVMGRTDQPHTFTYAPDFGRLLATLGTNEAALGQVWHVPSNKPITQAQLTTLISEAIGKSVKTLAASKLILQMLGLTDKTIHETVEMIYEFTGPFVMGSDKAQQAFGLRPTPLREAVATTVAWCRSYTANPQPASVPMATHS
jgi:nucleoside-diphosphate-sugar epimerase